MDIAPALGLLATRRRTNGYATLADLAETLGIDATVYVAGGELEALADALRLRGDVAVEAPIGLNEPTRYRLRT